MTERGATLEEPADAFRNVFRRRRFVVDGGYQYRAAFLAVAVALLLLLMLNLSLVFSTREGSKATAALAPELRSMIEAQDRVQIGLVATGSLVLHCHDRKRIHAWSGFRRIWPTNRPVNATSRGRSSTPIQRR